MFAMFQVNIGYPEPPGLSSSTCSGREPVGISNIHLLLTGQATCHPANIVKALKGGQSTDPARGGGGIAH